MKICIGSDHGGYLLKQEVIAHLKERGFEVTDVGCYSEESCDYPVYAKPVTDAIKDKTADFGILICGTGIGMSIAANKVKGIRAAKVATPREAALAKEHNLANVITLAEYTENLDEIIDSFIDTENSKEERHNRRVEKIMEIENE